MEETAEKPALKLTGRLRRDYDGHFKRYQMLSSLHAGLETHFESMVRGHVPTEIVPQARNLLLDGLAGGTNAVMGVSLLARVSPWAAMAPLFFAGWRATELPAQLKRRGEVMREIRAQKFVLASRKHVLSSRQVEANRQKLRDTMEFLTLAKRSALERMDSIRSQAERS